MKIFIIGMHRSGTSMITGLLYHCGLELGAPLLMHAKDNPRGHFENRQFIRINQNILIRNGGRWFAPPKSVKFLPGLREKMRAFLNEFDAKKISGFKDPRICLTLPLWREVVHPEPMKAVFVVRPFTAIAKSLKHRNNFPISRGIRLANIYVRSAFAAVHSLQIPFTTAVYHRFFKDWRRELAPILRFTGLELPENTKKIEDFIDESLWHHKK